MLRESKPARIKRRGWPALSWTTNSSPSPRCKIHMTEFMSPKTGVAPSKSFSSSSQGLARSSADSAKVC